MPEKKGPNDCAGTHACCCGGGARTDKLPHVLPGDAELSPPKEFLEEHGPVEPGKRRKGRR